MAATTDQPSDSRGLVVRAAYRLPPSWPAEAGISPAPRLSQEELGDGAAVSLRARPAGLNPALPKPAFLLPFHCPAALGGVWTRCCSFLSHRGSVPEAVGLGRP